MNSITNNNIETIVTINNNNENNENNENNIETTFTINDNNENNENNIQIARVSINDNNIETTVTINDNENIQIARVATQSEIDNYQNEILDSNIDIDIENNILSLNNNEENNEENNNHFTNYSYIRKKLFDSFTVMFIINLIYNIFNIFNIILFIPLFYNLYVISYPNMFNLKIIPVINVSSIIINLISVSYISFNIYLSYIQFNYLINEFFHICIISYFIILHILSIFISTMYIFIINEFIQLKKYYIKVIDYQINNI